MNDIPVDFMGTSLDVGTRVVFNLSGEMAIGEVVSFAPVKYSNSGYDYTRSDRLKYRGHVRHTFKVRQLNTPALNRLWVDKFSKINSQYNMVAVFSL